MSDDDLDFLDAAHDDGPALAAALEAVRTDLLDWAAAALGVRHPDLTPYAGRKGQLLARQDLDLHLKHLHAALAHGVDVAPGAWRRWLGPILAQRGVRDADVAAGVDVLAEALLRFLPPPQGPRAATALRRGCGSVVVASPAPPG